MNAQATFGGFLRFALFPLISLFFSSCADGNPLLPRSTNLTVIYTNVVNTTVVTNLSTNSFNPNWTLVAPTASFVIRGRAAVEFFNGRWVMTGGDTGGAQVWISSNLVSWIQVSSSPAFGDVYYHRMVPFQGSLYLTGGSGSKGNVFRSSDGVTWSVASSNWGFYRTTPGFVAFKEKLWILGGRHLDTGSSNDVFSSVDGLSWVTVTTNAGFPSRSDHAVVVFNDKLYVIGGRSDASVIRQDVWESTDGILWTQICASPAVKRASHVAWVQGGAIHIAGGNDGSSKLATHFTSTDGVNWRQVTGIPWSAREYSFVAVSPTGTGVMIGGHDAGAILNEVWSCQ